MTARDDANRALADVASRRFHDPTVARLCHLIAELIVELDKAQAAKVDRRDGRDLNLEAAA